MKHFQDIQKNKFNGFNCIQPITFIFVINIIQIPLIAKTDSRVQSVKKTNPIPTSRFSSVYRKQSTFGYDLLISFGCLMLTGFVSYHGSRILTLKDSFRMVNHESSKFSKIRLSYESNESLRILTNPQYYSTKQILKNRDSQIRILTNP